MKNGFKTLALLMTIFTMLVSPMALAQTSLEAGSSSAKSLGAGHADFGEQPFAEEKPIRYRDEIDAVDYTWMSLSSVGLGVAGAALGGGCWSPCSSTRRRPRDGGFAKRRFPQRRRRRR